MLIDRHDQQIVQRKTQNLELCFMTDVGTNQAKIEKIWISGAILLGPSAVKMLRDLQRRVQCLAQYVALANAPK